MYLVQKDIRNALVSLTHENFAIAIYMNLVKQCRAKLDIDFMS